MSKKIQFIFTISIFSLLCSNHALAVSDTWSGSDGDGVWGTTGNWAGGNIPATGDTATFDDSGSAANAIDLGAGRTVSSVVIDNSGGGIGSYTIGDGAVGSDTLTLNNSGSVTMNANVDQDQLFNADIVLGTDATASSYTVTNNSAGNDLTLAGGISGGTGGVAGAKTMTVTGSGDTTISGIVSDGGASSLGVTKSGTGTLTLSGVNTYTGTTTVNAGTVALNESLTTSALAFTGGTVNLATGKTISTAITATNGTGTLNFAGSFTTSNDIGATGGLLDALNINGGTTTANHDIYAETVSNSGTFTLGSDTTINGDFTQATNGTLNLGTSQLTLDNAGTGGGIFTQGAGDTINVTINNSSTFGSIVADGDSVVTGGSVVVTTSGDHIPNGTTFAIIDGGAGGDASGVTVTDDSFVLDFTGSTGVADFTLTATRTNSYDNVATNGNNAAIGAALEQAGAGGATGDLADILNLLDSLGSAKEIDDALSTIIPDVSGGSLEMSNLLTNSSFALILDRLNAVRASSGVSTGDAINGESMWSQGYGSYTKQDERKGIKGYSAKGWGTTIGVDRLFSDKLRLGLAGGYSQARVRSKASGSPRTSIDSYQATIYGSYKGYTGNRLGELNSPEHSFSNWYLDGAFTFAWNEYDADRRILLNPTTTRVAEADYDAQQYYTKFELGYDHDLGPNTKLTLTPFISLAYSYLSIDGYTETGAGSLNLTVDGEGYESLLQGLGAKLSYPIVIENIIDSVLSVKAEWLHYYVIDKFESTASFVGGPSFTTSGAEPDDNGVHIGSEWTFMANDDLTLSIAYDVTTKDEYWNHTGSVKGRYDF